MSLPVNKQFDMYKHLYLGKLERINVNLSTEVSIWVKEDNNFSTKNTSSWMFKLHHSFASFHHHAQFVLFCFSLWALWRLRVIDSRFNFFLNTHSFPSYTHIAEIAHLFANTTFLFKKCKQTITWPARSRGLSRSQEQEYAPYQNSVNRYVLTVCIYYQGSYHIFFHYIVQTPKKSWAWRTSQFQYSKE